MDRMYLGGRRSDAEALTDVQANNRRWWNEAPMEYDWKDTIGAGKYSREWFDAIDQRFIYVSRLFGHDQRPFDRIIPFEEIRGKKVLEIGCGMGLHTELMLRAGADVTSVDLTPTAVEATTKRLAVKGLNGRVMEADAEKLPFADQSFDFVWSWGVIHHSARTSLIVRHIARVLRPDGACRIMVYNRNSLKAHIVWLRELLTLGFRKRSFDEALWRATDGYTARHYVPEQFADLFRAFFNDVNVEVMGGEGEAMPIGGKARGVLKKIGLVGDAHFARWQANHGGFIFLRAAGPF